MEGRTGMANDDFMEFDESKFDPGHVTEENLTEEMKRDFIDYSMSVIVSRALPDVRDGLKPVQRKAIYTMYKKNIKSEVKVSSLSGTIIETAAYHNGNVSLEKAIVNMAQDFVGSNNLNLLLPKGQFGSRLKGGEDAASARYIFTKLNDVASYIINKDDNEILTYQNDDGFPIEPVYYVPIIPMILVNGGSGIGSAYATNIPSFNPIEIITYLQNKIKGKKNIELTLYYKDFREYLDKFINMPINGSLNNENLV
jgi:DNA topoisomerase-2